MCVILLSARTKGVSHKGYLADFAVRTLQASEVSTIVLPERTTKMDVAVFDPAGIEKNERPRLVLEPRRG